MASGGVRLIVLRYIGDAQWTALDADAKPTNAAVADTLTTLDTRRIFIHQGSAVWIEIGTGTGGGGGGGGGFAAGGTMARSGDGTSTIISIPHGLSPTPDLFYALPLNAAARGIISYGIDGTNINLTYPIAPASGASNLSYVWGAGYVNASGAGSTPTQPVKYLVYKLGTTFYAKNGNTGAIDSSNTSAATVIQYALDNLTAGRTWKETVKLRGDFSPSTVTIQSFTALDLTEARLLLANSTNANLLKNADQTNGNTAIEIIGGVVDGNKANNTQGTEDGNSMIFFNKCSDIFIHGGLYKNGTYHNIRFTDCTTDIRVNNITSLDARREHISDHAQGTTPGTCRGHSFCNNYMENIVAGNSFLSTVNVSDALVCGNVCKKTFENTSGIATNGPRTIIANNTIRDTYQAIVLAQVLGSDFDSTGTVIHGNLIYNSALHGITASVQPGRDVVISNNIVDTTLGAGSAGIAFSGFDGLTIVGNVVRRAFGNGILVYGSTALPTKNIVIADNICYNNCQQPAVADNNAAGIASRSLNALGDIQYLNIHGNQCFDNQTTKTQKWGIRLSLVSNSVARFNDLRNNLTAGYSDVSGSGNLEGGNVGFLTANADTSAATLPNVEIEVNQLKATLRAAGLIG